jgi:anti-sigma factor RsiW
MRQCEDFRNNLSEYLDGEVSPDFALQFQEHLADCGRCQEELASFEQVGKIITTHLPTLEPPPDIWYSVHRNILSAPVVPPLRFSLSMKWASAFAMLVVALVVAGALIFRHWDQVHRVEQTFTTHAKARQQTLRQGNPFGSAVLSLDGVSKDNPFSPYLRVKPKNPFKEMK